MTLTFAPTSERSAGFPKSLRMSPQPFAASRFFFSFWETGGGRKVFTFSFSLRISSTFSFWRTFFRA
jgi:hypothetical protein